MSDKPQRRWYQFSLRTMLVVTAIVAVPLARVAYLVRMAEYHERAADRSLADEDERVRWKYNIYRDAINEGREWSITKGGWEEQPFIPHCLLAREYLSAARCQKTQRRISPLDHRS